MTWRGKSAWLLAPPLVLAVALAVCLRRSPLSPMATPAGRREISKATFAVELIHERAIEQQPDGGSGWSPVDIRGIIVDLEQKKGNGLFEFGEDGTAFYLRTDGEAWKGDRKAVPSQGDVVVGYLRFAYPRGPRFIVLTAHNDFYEVTSGELASKLEGGHFWRTGEGLGD